MYYLGHKSTFTWGENSSIHKIQTNWLIFFHQYFVYDFLSQLWLLPFAAALICRTFGGILSRLDSRLFMRFFQSFDWGHATKIFYCLYHDLALAPQIVIKWVYLESLAGPVNSHRTVNTFVAYYDWVRNKDNPLQSRAVVKTIRPKDQNDQKTKRLNLNWLKLTLNYFKWLIMT